MEIKLETRDGAHLHKRWLDEFPDWPSLNTAALTIKDGGREVLIADTDESLPLGHHVVSYSENIGGAGRSYSRDCGTNLQDAWAFAQQVLEKGAEAY